MTSRAIAGVVALSAVLAGSMAGAQVGTTFTYQGRLTTGGAPATAPVDLRFRLFDAAAGGTALGATLQRSGVTPTEGLFSSSLDFGAGMFGGARWVEISVAPAGTGSFTALSPRQPVTPAPQALFATQAESLTTQAASFFQNASNLSAGTIPSARLTGAYSGPLTFANAANVFTGSGAGLTGLNAANMSSGVLSDARLSANIVRLNTANVFSQDISTLTGLVVDVGGANDGSIGRGLRFGGSGSGEGVMSRRLGSDNVQGLELLTAGTPRLSITNAGNIGIGTLTPGAKLDVAGTVRGTAVQFADGSVQTRAALDPGRTGSRSGLPATASYRVIVNGQTATGVTLAGPVSMETSYDANGQPTGTMEVTSFIRLRRSAAGGTIWGAGFTNNVVFGDLSIELAQNGTPGAGPRATWAFGSTRSTAWRVMVGDDGGPVEEVTLWFDRGLVTRTPSGVFATASLPSMGARTGENGGGSSAFRVSLAGTLGTGCIVGQDLAQTAPFDRLTGQRSGRVTVPAFTVRTTMSDNLAASWYSMWRTGSRTTIALLAWTPGGQVSVLSTTNARGYGWSLAPTDDGALVEDIKVVVSSN